MLCSQKAGYIAREAAKMLSVRWSVLYPSWRLCSAVICAARSAVIIKRLPPLVPQSAHCFLHNWKNNFSALPNIQSQTRQEMDTVKSCYKAVKSTLIKNWIIIIIIRPRLLKGRSSGHRVFGNFTSQMLVIIFRISNHELETRDWKVWAEAFIKLFILKFVYLLLRNVSSIVS